MTLLPHALKHHDTDDTSLPSFQSDFLLDNAEPSSEIDIQNSMSPDIRVKTFQSFGIQQILWHKKYVMKCKNSESVCAQYVYVCIFDR